MKARSVSALIVVIAILFLASCAQNDSPENNSSVTDSADNIISTYITIISGGATDYSIVRPDVDAFNEYTDIMSGFKNTLNNKYGVNIVPKTDWLNSGKGELAPDKEILIGPTIREESQTVLASLKGPRSFAIAVVNEKLVIIGGDSVSTKFAADYFTNNLLGDELKLERGFRYDGEMPLDERIASIDGININECNVTELYDGVISTYYSLSEGSKYGQQKFTVVEFNPKQSDLYFRVTMGGSTTNQLVTVGKTVDLFNKNNDEGLTAISAVNGDLWMIKAHARYIQGHEYKGYTDMVVSKLLTVPRGLNIYNGEIVSSSHMTQETPYEGKWYCFGITEDGTPLLGQLNLGITVNNTTKGKSTSADGLNRLPANNALVVFSDVYSTSNYSLSDAREVIIDCSENYTVTHGAKINGKVIAITEPGSAKYDMKDNYIILTARGTRTSSLEGYAVGDVVELSFNLTDNNGNTEEWRTMKNAVGGHIPVIINGVSQGSGDSTKYPMSVLGIKENGNVVMLTNDGRQDGWSKGIMISMLDELCKDLDIITAFILDGGGSVEMVNLVNDEYITVNRPSDGSSRAVVNTVILAYGADKEKQ